MANWLTQQQRPGLVQPGAGVRATHSSAGLLFEFVTSLPHHPALYPAVASFLPRSRHCSPPACTRPGEKASLQRLPSWWAPLEPTGGRRAASRRGRPEGRDSHKQQWL